MTYSPPGDRGWIVTPAYRSDSLIDNVLVQLENDKHATGLSDVGIRNLLFMLTLSLRPRRALEVGGHIGAATIPLGFALKLNQYGKLICLEPNEHFLLVGRSYIYAAELTNQVQYVSSPSTDKNCQAMLKSEAPFELIFIDGSHNYDDVTNDLRLCFEILAEGGVMVLHDSGLAAMAWDTSDRGGVRCALQDFVAQTKNASVTFLDHPIWLNPCGAAIVSKGKQEC